MKREVQWRYVENGGEWRLGRMDDGGPFTASAAERPEWLENIVTLAKIGGHGVMVYQPPPDYILWFTTTENFELVGFDPAF